MKRREALENCRDAYEHLKGQKEALGYLMRTLPDAPEARQVCEAQLHMVRRIVQAMEADYQISARTAQDALSPLVGREAYVLTQYYIYGATLRGIARSGKWDVRTVTRTKARALAKLDEMEETS